MSGDINPYRDAFLDIIRFFTNVPYSSRTILTTVKKRETLYALWHNKYEKECKLNLDSLKNAKNF